MMFVFFWLFLIIFNKESFISCKAYYLVISDNAPTILFLTMIDYSSYFGWFYYVLYNEVFIYNIFLVLNIIEF